MRLFISFILGLYEAADSRRLEENLDGGTEEHDGWFWADRGREEPRSHTSGGSDKSHVQLWKWPLRGFFAPLGGGKTGLAFSQEPVLRSFRQIALTWNSTDHFYQVTYRVRDVAQPQRPKRLSCFDMFESKAVTAGRKKRLTPTWTNDELAF